MEYRYSYSLLAVAFLCLLLTFPVAALAEVTVIANKAITVESVTAAEAQKIFLGKKKSMPGGGVIKLADLPKGNATRKEFYDVIVKKKGTQLRAYWAKVTFAGKGYPPKVSENDAEVVKWVAETKGAMGYVSSASVNDSVNVLLKK